MSFETQKISHILPVPGTNLERYLVPVIFLFNWQNQLILTQTDSILSKT